ncbi:hypothetical protein [Pseudonocardia sp. T1-2H]|uniref:hypothetical protein n=1 Tax=Pseudonocardia sp. T1-2H TaxID=3128899 RepID=UPI003100C870
MTQLSRLAIVGLAKEATAGTYVVPTTYVPFTKADFEDNYAEIKDESIRANDSVLQGAYQGPVTGSWSLDLLAYPDVLGHFLASMIGPDSVAAGVSTTLSASSAVNATTISTAVSIPAQTVIQIDTAANVEFAKVTAVSGAGPYTLTVTTSDTGAVGLTKAHTSAAPVIAQTTHTFKQVANVQNPTLSISVYDTLTTLGYSYAALSDLSIKIDPKASVSLTSKFTSMPGVAQTALTPTFTQLPPLLGWQWTMTNAGAASTRGLSFDLNLKRTVDPVHSSDGTQGPREIFQGALTADGSYKAIFENQTDLALYNSYSQQPATALLQQPTVGGGASLALTMSKSGWVKGKREWGGAYVQASFSLSGIYNTVDGGSVSAVLKNFRTTAF